MAVLLQLTVAPATQEQFNELDAMVGQSMMQAGGPPDGLMSHAVYPEGDGFVISEAWRGEAEGGPTSTTYCGPWSPGSDSTRTRPRSARLPFARP